MSTAAPATDTYDYVFGDSTPAVQVPVALESTKPFTKDMEATTALLQNVLDVVAECEEAPSFAGFQIQEQRSESGLLLSMRLVPCDMIAGIVSPRVV